MSKRTGGGLEPKPHEVSDVSSLSGRIALTHLERPQHFNNEVRQAQLNTGSSVSPNFNLSPSPILITTKETNEQSLQTLQSTTSTAPSPSTSLPAFDPNNNKDNLDQSTSTRPVSLLGLRRSNFSKSTSGGHLVNTKSDSRPLSGYLAQNCSDKEHPNRQQFIEHYYYSRTQLPNADAVLSFNINTPLSSLNECDAITKRLLSSPIRTTNFNDRSASSAQGKDVDVTTRRASLGTSTMTDQVFLFSSNQYDSLETTDHRNSQSNINAEEDNQPSCDLLLGITNSNGEYGAKLKQQQGRSLSVCHDDTLRPRYRKINSNHSSNLSRTVSLACESGAVQRSLTIIPLFGCDIEDLDQFMKLGLILPPPIDSAVDHILTNGAEAVGIFRKSGVKSRISNLRQRIEENQCVKMEEINMGNEFSIYDIADLVKMWFRELKPAPLMTKELIALISDFSPGTGHHIFKSLEHNNSSHVDKSEKEGRSSTIKQTAGDLKHKIARTLKPAHRALFSKALYLMTSIASRSEMNQMTSQNLAICLTPSLCATESDQVSIVLAQKALEYCIDNYRILF